MCASTFFFLLFTVYLRSDCLAPYRKERWNDIKSLIQKTLFGGYSYLPASDALLRWKHNKIIYCERMAEKKRNHKCIPTEYVLSLWFGQNSKHHILISLLLLFVVYCVYSLGSSHFVAVYYEVVVLVMVVFFCYSSSYLRLVPPLPPSLLYFIWRLLFSISYSMLFTWVFRKCARINTSFWGLHWPFILPQRKSL